MRRAATSALFLLFCRINTNAAWSTNKRRSVKSQKRQEQKLTRHRQTRTNGNSGRFWPRTCRHLPPLPLHRRSKPRWFSAADVWPEVLLLTTDRRRQLFCVSHQGRVENTPTCFVLFFLSLSLQFLHGLGFLVEFFVTLGTPFLVVWHDLTTETGIIRWTVLGCSCNSCWMDVIICPSAFKRPHTHHLHVLNLR